MTAPGEIWVPVGAQLYADRIRHVLSSSEFAHRHRMTASFAITSLP